MAFFEASCTGKTEGFVLWLAEENMPGKNQNRWKLTEDLKDENPVARESNLNLSKKNERFNFKLPIEKGAGR